MFSSLSSKSLRDATVQLCSAKEMNKSFTEIIEKVTLSEQQCDIQRKILLQTEEERSKVDENTQTMKYKIKGIQEKYKKRLEELASIETNLNIAQKKDVLLSNIVAEKEANLHTEEDALEKIQHSIWRSREEFCEQVQKFDEQFGITAFLKYIDDITIKAPEQENEECKFTEDPELVELEGDVSALETELQSVELEYQKLLVHKNKADEEHGQLMKEPMTGNEFKQLQENVKHSKYETDKLEGECEKTQAEIAKIDLMLQQNDVFSKNYFSESPTLCPVEQILHSESDSYSKSRYSNTDQCAVSTEGNSQELPHTSAGVTENSFTNSVSLKYSLRKSCAPYEEDKRPGKYFVPKKQSAISLRLLNKKQTALNCKEKLKELLKS